MQPLTRAKTGESYMIKWMIQSREFLEDVPDLIMEAGKQIALLGRTDGYILVRYEGRKYALSPEAAFCIKV